MPYRLALVLLLAATLTACGGGEDYIEPSAAAVETADELPQRGAPVPDMSEPDTGPAVS